MPQAQGVRIGYLHCRQQEDRTSHMIIGIDLGTTNSAAGVWRDGRAELIPNSLGSAPTPSAVSVCDDGELLVDLPGYNGFRFSSAMPTRSN